MTIQAMYATIGVMDSLEPEHQLDLIRIDIIVKLTHFYKVRYATLIGRPKPVLSDNA